MVCSDPRSREKLPSAGSLPSLAPMNPGTRSSRGQRVSFTSVPQHPRGVPVSRWRGTAKRAPGAVPILPGTLEEGPSRQRSQVQADKEGRSWGTGVSQGGRCGMEKTADAGDPGCTRVLPPGPGVHPSFLCDISLTFPPLGGSRWLGPALGVLTGLLLGDCLAGPFFSLTPLTSAARGPPPGPSAYLVCVALNAGQSGASLPQPSFSLSTPECRALSGSTPPSPAPSPSRVFVSDPLLLK